MQVEIELKHYVGWCKGILKTLPLDVVFLRRGEQLIKVGHIRHGNGAMLLFCKFIGDRELKDAITDAVVEARKDSKQGNASPFSAMIPNPREVKSFMKGEIKPKKKTFSSIVNSKGEPFRKRKKV